MTCTRLNWIPNTVLHCGNDMKSSEFNLIWSFSSVSCRWRKKKSHAIIVIIFRDISFLVRLYFCFAPNVSSSPPKKKFLFHIFDRKHVWFHVLCHFHRVRERCALARVYMYACIKFCFEFNSLRSKIEHQRERTMRQRKRKVLVAVDSFACFIFHIVVDNHQIFQLDRFHFIQLFTS